MIRIVVCVCDAGMAANVGGDVQRRYPTFDIECPEMEALLAKYGQDASGYVQAHIVGGSLLSPPAPEGGKK